MLHRPSTLQIAIGVSVAAHAALLGLRVVDPRAFHRLFEDAPLEVILVNSRSGEAPEKARAIAQAALNGGGDAESGRATSPLPPSAVVENGDATEESRRRVESLQDAQRELLARLQREVATLAVPERQRETGEPESDAREEQHRQLVQQLAEIERRIREENARPRKRFVSPATREAVYAMYYDRLRRKVEERGTRDFPESHGQKLYGELTMNVTVDAEGRLVDTEIVQSSNQPLLDRRAVAIVRAAAPYGRFSDEMRRRADQLVISSRFRFTRDDGLATTLTANPGSP